MKIHNQEIQQLLFFKKLAFTNRLHEIIHDEEEPYPPPLYTANQIYSSQYATALQTIKQEGLIVPPHPKDQHGVLNSEQQVKPRTSTKRRRFKQLTHLPSVKYPLPLAFAYFQAYEKEKYHEKAINVLKNHLQRKNGLNQHIIYYNLSYLYRERHDSKKAIFYLETVLKEKPFFEEAIIDYAFLLSMNNRGTEALQYLKRHLLGNSSNSHSKSPLSESSSIQSMFLNLAYQTKSMSQRQIIKIFSNKSLSLQTIFNLGLYFKKTKSFQKAQEVFSLLIEKYDSHYEECKQEGNSLLEFREKDQKVYFYAKINLSEMYELWAKEYPHDKENSQNHKQSIRAFKYKAHQVLESLTKNQKANHKCPNFYTKYAETIKDKMVKLDKEICSQTNNYLFQFNQNQLPKSNKNGTLSKIHSNQSQLKNINSIKNYPNLLHHSQSSTVAFNNIKKPQTHQKLPQNIQSQRNQLDLMKEFNKKFQQRRMENEKKLKFLLLKDKELDNFFNSLPKINFDKSTIAGEHENSTITNNNQSILTKNIDSSFMKSSTYPSNFPQNQTLIKRLRKQLQEQNALAEFENEFQKKKLKYEQEFQGYNLDEALYKIMDKIFSDPKKEAKQQISNLKQNNVQSPVKKGQNLLKSSQVKIIENDVTASFKVVKKADSKQQTQQKQFVRRSKQKQLTIEENIIKSTFTQRQNPVKKRFAENVIEQKRTSQGKRMNAQSERKVQRQVSTSGNLRIKNPLIKQSCLKPNQVGKSLDDKQEESKPENPKVQKTMGEKQKSSNAVQSPVKFKDSVKEVSRDIVYDIKELLKESVQNTQKNIKTHNIFVEKEQNNIEDIFEAFNPKSNHHILVNKSPVSQKKNMTRRGSEQYSPVNFFGFRLSEQNSEEKKIPLQYLKKYDMASQLQNEQQYTQAFDIYTEIYKEFKEDSMKQMTLLGIAYNFELQKQFDQAEKTYLKCCKYNNAETFMRLGKLLIRRNRIDEGIQNLQKANCIKRFDKEIETKLVYGYSLKQETIDKALSLAHLVLKRDPTSLQILIMTANILQKQSKIKEALQICLAIDCHKESQFIKHYIGTLYLTDGNVVEAFKYFKNALQIKSNHVPSLIEIGTILSQLKPKEAISILNKTLQIQPDNRLALARLAKIFQSIEENPEKAMEIYRKTLETKSNYEAYMKIGNCLETNGSYLQALVNYREALGLKKTHQAYMKIAEMHEFKKEYKKSIQNCQLALEIIPKQHKFHEEKKKIMISMAKNMLILQEFDNAILALETLLESQESKQIYSLLGQGYFGKQQYSIALEFYQKANGMEEKDDIEILERLALCFDKKEEFTASKKIYEKILQIDPHNIKCINNYANIMLIIGNTNEAFYWYEVMLQDCPKNIQKRIKVADIYSAVGDWSKVEYHLLICYKQKEHDVKVLEKLINLYKEKRQQKLVAKFQKKLAMLKVNNKKKEH